MHIAYLPLVRNSPCVPLCVAREHSGSTPGIHALLGSTFSVHVASPDQTNLWDDSPCFLRNDKDYMCACGHVSWMGMASVVFYT